MALSNFRILIHELLKNHPDIVPDAAPLIIFYEKSTVCMDNNGKYVKHNGHISRRV